MPIIEHYEEEATFEVPYGSSDLIGIYINEILYEDIDYFKITKYMNNVWTFYAESDDIVNGDVNVLHGKKIKVFIENKIFAVFKITDVTYNTDEVAIINAIGVCAYNLKERTVGQNVTNESVFVNQTSAFIANRVASVNNDGVTPWLVTINNIDTHPSLYVRGDNENKLALFMNTITAANYDWAENYGTLSNSYNTEQIDIDDHIGSTTSTFTFNVDGTSQNAELTTREEDREAIGNDITIAGYGDGVNQIKSRAFHATLNRTYLTSAMTASGTETINVNSTTGFSSSGTLWIGCEKVTYTGKTGTAFTGITRGSAFMSGTNVTRSYIHTAYIDVYDAQYTTTSAETGSSIGDGSGTGNANWGIKQKFFNDSSIIDQDTLDKIAQRNLSELKDLIIRIDIIPMDLYEVISATNIGDVVTINDTTAGNTTTYRLIGYEIGINEEGEEYCLIKCSNRYTTMMDSLIKTAEEQKKLSQYMQGSTVIFPISNYENCDTDKPLYMRFYLPSEVVAINSVKLNFKMKNYRADAQSVTGTPLHATQYSIWNAGSLKFITSSDGANDGVVRDYTMTINADGGGHLTSWGYSYNTYNVYWNLPVWTSSLIPTVSGGAFDRHKISAYIRNGGNVTRVPTVRLLRNYATKTVNENPLGAGDTTITLNNTTGLSSSGYILVQQEWISYSGISGNDLTGCSRGLWGSIDTSHGLSSNVHCMVQDTSWSPAILNGDQTNISYEPTTNYSGQYYVLVMSSDWDPNISGTYPNEYPDYSQIFLGCSTFHKSTDDLNFGIRENTTEFTPPGTVAVYCNIDGSSDSLVGNYSSDQTNLDITSKVTTAGNWYVIKVVPTASTYNGRMRIEANAYIQAFIKAQ